jgi:hypothetical protein
MTGSQRSASSGRLNAALNRLAAAIDPPTAAAGSTFITGNSRSADRSRVLCAEIIVAHLQAVAILAHKKQQPQVQAGQQQQQQQTQQQQQQAQQPAAGAAAAGDMEVDEKGDALASTQLQAIARLLGLEDHPPARSAWATHMKPCNALQHLLILPPQLQLLLDQAIAQKVMPHITEAIVQMVTPQGSHHSSMKQKRMACVGAQMLLPAAAYSSHKCIMAVITALGQINLFIVNE